MAAWLQQVWHYEIQVVPVLLAMLLIEIPTAVRRLQKFYYVPIYFSVFPLRAERLRKKILTTSIISIALSALVIPLFAGFGSAFFLVPPLVRQFILVFVVYKSIGIIRAIIGFPSHAVGTRRNLALLILIYIGYLGVASRMILNSYGFARPFVESHDWIGLASVTSDLLFSRVMVEFLLLALITTAFTNFIMDRKVRRENLRRFQTDEYSDPASSP
jgi:hypothetical protein